MIFKEINFFIKTKFMFDQVAPSAFQHRFPLSPKKFKKKMLESIPIIILWTILSSLLVFLVYTEGSLYRRFFF
jgi:hypothetical protein